MKKSTVVRGGLAAVLVGAAITVGVLSMPDKPAVEVGDQPNTVTKTEVVEQIAEQHVVAINPENKGEKTNVVVPNTTTDPIGEDVDLKSDISMFFTDTGSKTIRAAIQADLKADIEKWVSNVGGWEAFFAQSEEEQAVLPERNFRLALRRVNSRYATIRDLYFKPRISKARKIMMGLGENPSKEQNTLAKAELEILRQEVATKGFAFSRYNKVESFNLFQDHTLQAEFSSAARAEVWSKGISELGELTNAEQKIVDSTESSEEAYELIMYSRADTLIADLSKVAKGLGVEVHTPIVVDDENNKLSPVEKVLKFVDGFNAKVQKLKEKASGQGMDFSEWQKKAMEDGGVVVDLTGTKPKIGYGAFIGWYMWYLREHVQVKELEGLEETDPKYGEIEALYANYEKDVKYKNRVKAVHEHKGEFLAKAKAAEKAHNEKINGPRAILQAKMKEVSDTALSWKKTSGALEKRASMMKYKIGNFNLAKAKFDGFRKLKPSDMMPALKEIYDIQREITANYIELRDGK